MRFLLRRPEPILIPWLFAETGCNMADIEALVEQDLLLVRETEVWRDPLANLRPAQGIATGSPKLTPEQQAAWGVISAALSASAEGKPGRPILLHGITGSGKTELYIRAAQETLARGKQALVLVPEIALTPQTVQRFVERFPAQVGVLHSALSDGERYDTWRRVRSGALSILIGARSAAFGPLSRLGLIVLDECHDASYFQADPPFYNAGSVARDLANRAGALLILGSATPAVTQRYEADADVNHRLTLTRRVSVAMGEGEQDGLPSVSLVDMRMELRNGNLGIFSPLLTEQLAATLHRGQQAILLVNRRGTATYMFCRSCGSAIRCPRCDMPMTLHLAEGARLRCHHCAHNRAVPASCPQCGGPSLGAYGLGTERVSRSHTDLPNSRTLQVGPDTAAQGLTRLSRSLCGGAGTCSWGLRWFRKGWIFRK
jgi:primosomal protein N' (replication factor Y)